MSDNSIRLKNAASVLSVDGGMAQNTQALHTNSADWTTAIPITGAPVTGMRVILDDIVISTDTALTVTIKHASDSSVVFGPQLLPAGYVGQITLRSRIEATKTDSALKLVASATGNIYVDTRYHSEV